MAFRLRRLRTLSFLNQFLHHQQKSATVSHIPRVSTSTTLSSTNRLTMRPFTSTRSLFMSYDSEFEDNDPEFEETGPPPANNTIFLAGCDFKHWLITINFPKDANLSRERMIETYIDTAAQIFGSVEEAKKKIYALSTTTYHGFQVECTEETSKKFQNIPGVVFVLPDTYIDIVNKRYGGDKYVNGEIFPGDLPPRGEEFVNGALYPRDMSLPDGRRTSGDGRPREQMPYQQKSQQNFVDECLNW